MSARYDQCDDTCTVDCGHCKGAGRPDPVVSPVQGEAVETLLGIEPRVLGEAIEAELVDRHAARLLMAICDQAPTWAERVGDVPEAQVVSVSDAARVAAKYVTKQLLRPVAVPTAREGETDELMLPPNPFGTSATWGDYDWYEIAGDVLHGKPYAETVAHKVLRLIADTLAGESS